MLFRYGHQPNDLPIDAGIKILRHQFHVMEQNEEGTIQGNDALPLHDMRVAIRRMRVALEIYKEVILSPRTKPVKRVLQTTAKALGPVRDLDVFLEKARDYSQKVLDLAERQTFEAALLPWVQKRVEARKAMRAFLTGEEYQASKASLVEFVESVQGKLSQTQNAPPELRLRDFVAQTIESQYCLLIEQDQSLQNASIQRLHALRIQFKKFRYTIEFFYELLGNEAGELLRLNKFFQNHLGDLHDAEIAWHVIDSRISRNGNMNQDEFQGVKKYQDFKERECQKLLETFPTLWSRFMSEKTRDDVQAAISAI